MSKKIQFLFVGMQKKGKYYTSVFDTNYWKQIRLIHDLTTEDFSSCYFKLEESKDYDGPFREVKLDNSGNVIGITERYLRLSLVIFSDLENPIDAGEVRLIVFEE